MRVKNIVLVHGGFVDGAGWESVYKILKKDGYNVSIVQNPTTSLEDDVAAAKRILAAQDGPAILVQGILLAGHMALTVDSERRLSCIFGLFITERYC